MPTPARVAQLPTDVTAIAETCLELRAGALEVAVSARRLLEALSAVDTTLGTAAPGTEPLTPAAALLAGHPATTSTGPHGMAIETAYYVLALGIPAHPGERHPAVDGDLVARRRLRCIQAELGSRCADKALWVLGPDGGTVLIPESATAATELDAIVTGLAAVAQVALTATVIPAPTPGIPGAAEQAHELLDIVHRLQCEPGLYRFDDLAMEYQLTRPGPGREYLGALLDPLDEYPELLETLRRHLGNDLNRRRTARGLGVHANTIDYRLKRIGQLTGFDPAQSAGLWYLRSALVARTYRAAGEHAPQ
ncbi:helix-turn-helix domain-containing protein [Nocardia sp. NBC_01503]|uniref:PucR family transcriptional regulator n=1 Tax=Nocardia sp. NBC_01503 TaxID=2975997 RepID=UPI002E7BD4D4|nr:helix-turn-helix domain-containing protein [Nocardia sp. NBC_01503]WTL32014.1 helix-turn-helix domain-containing protein [Nocardia sp. NBC_01503]